MIDLLDAGPLVSALAREEPPFGTWAKTVLRHSNHVASRVGRACNAIQNQRSSVRSILRPVSASSVAMARLKLPLSKRTISNLPWPEASVRRLS